MPEPKTKPSVFFEERNQGPNTYGAYYWCVKSLLGQKGEPTDIYLFADNFEIVHNGCLCFYGHSPSSQERELRNAFAPGTWKAVYAASCFDGSAVAVQWWDGEVDR